MQVKLQQKGWKLTAWLRDLNFQFTSVHQDFESNLQSEFKMMFQILASGSSLVKAVGFCIGSHHRLKALKWRPRSFPLSILKLHSSSLHQFSALPLMPQNEACCLAYKSMSFHLQKLHCIGPDSSLSSPCFFKHKKSICPRIARGVKMQLGLTGHVKFKSDLFLSLLRSCSKLKSHS